ncbi:MAG: hypothetical protein K1X57_08115 [Gemmataceae bacterium]|nr:hypothetical protein [Gemmataceae bacterium]
MKRHWRILFVMFDVLVVALVLMPFVRPDSSRSPSPYDQSIQIGMGYDEAIAKMGNPQVETAFWKKADGNVMVFTQSGDRTIASVHISPENAGLAGLSVQQYLAIGSAVLGFVFGQFVLPRNVEGWRSIVLTISVPTLYGLGGAVLSAFARAWFKGLL